jgi:hypothetical protein
MRRWIDAGFFHLCSATLVFLLLVSCGPYIDPQKQAWDEFERQSAAQWLKALDRQHVADSIARAQARIERTKPHWGTVSVELANVRSEPDANSAIVAKVKRGECIELQEQLSGWWSVIIVTLPRFSGHNERIGL